MRRRPLPAPPAAIRTTYRDGGSPDIGRRISPASTFGGRGYRWRCPICGTSRVNTMSEQGRNALEALKRHVYRTEGDGHGETGAYPDDLSVDRLQRYVRPAGTGTE